MKKKIFIGSIIAVVILVLVSFTGVVGHQTTKSSTIAKASPLFSVRSTRAIDEESKDLTCDYVGRDKEITIPLPARDDKTALLQKFIDTINNMRNDEFNSLIAFAIRKLDNKYKFEEDDISKIRDGLQHLKDGSSNIGKLLTVIRGCDGEITSSIICKNLLFIFITIYFILILLFSPPSSLLRCGPP